MQIWREFADGAPFPWQWMILRAFFLFYRFPWNLLQQEKSRCSCSCRRDGDGTTGADPTQVLLVHTQFLKFTWSWLFQDLFTQRGRQKGEPFHFKSWMHQMFTGKEAVRQWLVHTASWQPFVHCKKSNQSFHRAHICKSSWQKRRICKFLPLIEISTNKFLKRVTRDKIAYVGDPTFRREPNLSWTAGWVVPQLQPPCSG